jgi:predicted AAA+ superfamily ATPase
MLRKKANNAHHIAMIVERDLNLAKLLAKKSHFLFGPRGTGKTHLVKTQLGEQALTIDLLSDDVYSRLLRRPSLLGEMIENDRKLVVVDEVQKLPVLLDEIHRLIEARRITFLLTGSSARKLRHGAANLLGGRAWETKLFPLTWHELGEHFDLDRYLTFGGLPAVYFSASSADELKNYAKLYLREEIQSEGIVRRFDHFVRFLDVAALCSGKELNFETVANESGVPSRTVAGYFDVLGDTLVGFAVKPFQAGRKRKAVKRSKFYLFDVGVAGSISRRGEVLQGSPQFGDAFEHFIAQELRAYLHYRNLDIELSYWRTVDQDEVDFVIGNEFAVEIKGTERASPRLIGGLLKLKEEGLQKRFFLVSRDPVRSIVDGVEIIPWQEFLTELWNDRLVGK